MFANLGGWHLLLILAVILLIFGATRLPALARSLGQSTKILKDELKDGSKDDGKTQSTAANETPASTSTPESATSGSATSTTSGGSAGTENRPS